MAWVGREKAFLKLTDHYGEVKRLDDAATVAGSRCFPHHARHRFHCLGDAGGRGNDEQDGLSLLGPMGKGETVAAGRRDRRSSR